MTAPGYCSICTDQRGPIVNAFLQGGRNPHWISGRLREMGHPTKRETIAKHLRVCLAGDASRVAILEQALTPPGEKGKDINPNADFALAIRAEANKMLAEGKLNINAQHGIAAQALIDRRVEKAADRQLMVQLASLLSGQAGPPAELIEAEWHEVDVPPVPGRTGLVPELT